MIFGQLLRPQIAADEVKMTFNVPLTFLVSIQTIQTQNIDCKTANIGLPRAALDKERQLFKKKGCVILYF